MPCKDPEKAKLCKKKWDQSVKGKEYNKQYNKQWYQNNKEKVKQYYQKNQEIIKQNNKQWRQNKKLQVYNYYSNFDVKCNCCGERQIEFLALDHIYNNGGHHRRKIGSDIYSWIIKNNYPSIFQLLCHNCNHARGHNPDKICPHQRQKAEIILGEP